MAALAWEDDPLASRSDTESDAAGCFSNVKGNETDCSSIAGDERNNIFDGVEDVGAWLLNEKKHPPEHYLAEKTSLDPSRL
jgi:hypothetical protein